MKFLRGLVHTSLLVSALPALLMPQTGQACLPCHPREVARFRASPMGMSLSKPSGLPNGAFEHASSGSQLRIYSKDGQMHHALAERGLTAEYPIAYTVGAGNVGQSFLVLVADHLFQSPASFYSARRQWDLSPGYENEKVLDFNRSITSDCLFCHSNSGVKATSAGELEPIGCERCHGSPEAHLRNPVPGSIVNPAKLPGRARESVCEQCHLEGATAVLNPDKYWWDFKPGEPLEAVEAHYVYRSKDGTQLPIPAVSQAEQLVLSKCYRNSGGDLWCGSCHNPHGEPVDRTKQIRQTCLGCHPAAQVATTHTASQQDCTSCHMPRRPATDIAHAAITDHRISARFLDEGNPKTTPSLTAWQEPAPLFVRRDLGLAHFLTAKRQSSAAALRTAYDLLRELPPGQADDAVEAARGYILLAAGNVTAAVDCFRQATERKPDNPEYWLDLGVADEAGQKPEDAATAFKRSIDLAPWDYRSYEALARLYDTAGRPREAHRLRESFLESVPESIIMRLADGQTTRPQ